jgi:hypothetical protein
MHYFVCSRFKPQLAFCCNCRLWVKVGCGVRRQERAFLHRLMTVVSGLMLLGEMIFFVFVSSWRGLLYPTLLGLFSRWIWGSVADGNCNWKLVATRVCMEFRHLEVGWRCKLNVRLDANFLLFTCGSGRFPCHNFNASYLSCDLFSEGSACCVWLWVVAFEFNCI